MLYEIICHDCSAVDLCTDYGQSCEHCGSSNIFVNEIEDEEPSIDTVDSDVQTYSDIEVIDDIDDD